MANFTLSFPDGLKKRMEEHSEIRWSAAVRSIIEQKLDDLDEWASLTSKSRLTVEDVKKLAAEVDEKMGKRAEERLNEISRRR